MDSQDKSDVLRTTCLLCRANGRVIAEKPRFRLYRCSACTFVWSDLSVRYIYELYGQSYFDAWGITCDEAAIQVVRRMKRAGFRRYLKEVQRYLPLEHGQKLLDVGCATGFLLEEAQEQGYDFYGVEPSPYAARVAQARFANRVVCGTLSDASFPAASFDVVVMADVIEHVPDPMDEVSLVRFLLKPGGVLLVVTPNIASLSSRLFGPAWVNVKEEHLWYFDKKTVRSFLGGILQVEQVRPVAKSLSLLYLKTQLDVYRIPVVSRLAPLIISRLPSNLREAVFSIPSGDLLAVSRLR